MRAISLFLAVSILAACTLDTGEHALDPATASAAAELTATDVQIGALRSFPGGIHGMAVTDTGRLYVTDSFGALGAKRSVTLELVGQNLGLPVVITQRGPGALLANSANSPARLLAIYLAP